MVLETPVTEATTLVPPIITVTWEKNNALNVALKVGRILQEDAGTQVIYTRKTDVFIPLDERADIANKSKADIFVSIHCNANKNLAASGSETYVMGVTRNAANLEVGEKKRMRLLR